MRSIETSSHCARLSIDVLDIKEKKGRPNRPDGPSGFSIRHAQPSSQLAAHFPDFLVQVIQQRKSPVVSDRRPSQSSSVTLVVLVVLPSGKSGMRASFSG